MRQLIVQVPHGHGEAVLDIAGRLEATSTTVLPGTRGDERMDVVLVHVSNRGVGPFLDAVEDLPEVHVSFYPMGVLALTPPPTEAADQVTDVELLSPVEVYLAGRQSVGSWKGFLGYAAAAGAVVWVGLHTGSIYLLIAAMLVAPFAGPAMNSAIATAAGEVGLLRKSLIRYVVALGVTIVVAFVLTFLIGPDSPSPLMSAQAQVSSVAILLPLVAGASGALYLLTSERNSLVSGAAVGLLVAASLAPPAGVVGMAAAIGRWDMAQNALFVLVLQLAGIHLSGTMLFRAGGLTHKGSRRKTGERRLMPIAITATAALLAILLIIQYSDPVALRRTTLAQTISTEIERGVRASRLRPDHINTMFTNTPGDEPPVLLAEVFVRDPGADLRDSTSQALVRRIHERISNRWPEITPVLDVRWVLAPDSQTAR